MDVTQGEAAPFTSLWFDETGTMLQDLASLTFSVVDSANTVAFGPVAQLAHPGIGVYSYVWNVPANLAAGAYTAVWNGVDTDSAPAVQEEDIAVGASTTGVFPPGSWASVAEVATYTGVAVTPAQLTQAQAIVDMFAGRTYDAAPRTGSRDRYWLKLTVAYQAAWLTSQPDLFQRIDLAAITMGSRAVALKDDSLRIAPLAAKALSKVSWMRGRSLHVQAPFTDSYGGLLNPNADSAANDLAFPWYPVGG
jgi:hypothetical protein